jgi:hypothetical protein
VPCGDQQGQTGDDDDHHDDARQDHSRNRAGPNLLERIILILEQSVTEHEQGKAAVPQDVDPARGVKPGAKQPLGRERARKRQHPWHGHQPGKKISARNHEERPGPKNRKLRKQQDRGEQIGYGHRGGVNRDERVERGELDASELPHRKRQSGQQDDEDGERKPLLCPAWSQARDCEFLPLRDGGPRLVHASASW